MERDRSLEIMSANAILKAVSSRYAPGAAERILQFLSDRGAVGVIINEYYASDDIEKTCLNYWNALIEPDALRLEDLVSALLISFATSFAASIIIESGKSAFPALYKRFVKSNDIEMTLKKLAKLENRRRQHAETLLSLLNKKAIYIQENETELQQKLNLARTHLVNGGSLQEFSAALPHLHENRDLTSIESVVRGTLLTEEGRISGFNINKHASGAAKIKGLPLSKWIGIGQIVQSRIEKVSVTEYHKTSYIDAEEFRADVFGFLQNIHKHAYLKSYLNRVPKKIIPVADYDLGMILKKPRLFMECRPFIGAFVLRYGGMVCHTGVLSRGMGIPCIQLGSVEFNMLKKYQFAAVQEGIAMLWESLPNELYEFL